MPETLPDVATRWRLYRYPFRQGGSYAIMEGPDLPHGAGIDVVPAAALHRLASTIERFCDENPNIAATFPYLREALPHPDEPNSTTRKD